MFTEIENTLVAEEDGGCKYEYFSPKPILSVSFVTWR